MALRQQTKDFTDIRGMRGIIYGRVSYATTSDGQQPDETSPEQQIELGRDWADRNGVELVEEPFKDVGISASRIAAKKLRDVNAIIARRPGFKDTLDRVKAGGIDLVWVWAVDRQSRDLRVFAELRDLFQDHQVALVVNGRVHDPNDFTDWMMLGFMQLMAEQFSDQLSKNVTRGKNSFAHEGNPVGGRAPFGYRRQYGAQRPEGMPDRFLWWNRNRKLWAYQEPDAWDDDGRPIEDTRAWWVREIYRRIAAGESLVRIADDMTGCGLEHPIANKKTRSKRYPWRHNDIRAIACNPVYIAKYAYRVDGRHDDPVAMVKAIMPDVKAKWPPLIDEPTFWQVHRILADRKRTRPAAVKSLLSYLAKCAECGGPLQSRIDRKLGYQLYFCNQKGCASIKRDSLDAYVDKRMLKWLSQHDVAFSIVRQAQLDADQARAKLDQMRAMDVMTVDPMWHGNMTKQLIDRIVEADRRAETTPLPFDLNGYDTPGEAWSNASIDVKRTWLAQVADIRLKPTGRLTGRLQKQEWKNPDVTLADIARRAGCSVSLVSNALNDRGKVSPASRERIKTIARELDYRPRDPGYAYVLPVEERAVVSFAGDEPATQRLPASAA
jgi:site-specific DNA recombinase